MNTYLKNKIQNAYICKLIDGDMLISFCIEEIKIEDNKPTGAFVVKKPLKICEKNSNNPEKQFEYDMFNPFSAEENFVFSGSHILNVSLANIIITKDYFNAISVFYDDDDDDVKYDFKTNENWGLN
jgi:hypothetical protein